VILVVLVVVGVPLFALVYLLVTSDPAQATVLRWLAHASITVGATWSFLRLLPDGGLLLGIAAVVALVGCLTTALHVRALLSGRRGRSGR
jgi:hypothetical protein